jgi:hypothetical protein
MDLKRIFFVKYPPYLAVRYIKTRAASVSGSEEAKYNLMKASLNLVLFLVLMTYTSLQLNTCLIIDITIVLIFLLVLKIQLKLPKTRIYLD